MTRTTMVDGSPAGSPTTLRQRNERAVLKVLLDSGACTRSQLTEATGLSLPTASRAVANLQARGVVVPAPAQCTRRGPAALAYEVRPRDRWFAVAAAVTGEQISVSVADAAGRTLHSSTATPDPSASAGALAVQTVDAYARTLRAAKVARRHVAHMTLAVPAVVGPDGGLDERWGPALAGITPQYVQSVRKAVRVHCTIENDVNLAALGELRVGAGRGTADLVYLALDRDVGVGLVIGGRLHRGAHGVAGEASHLPVGPADPFAPATRQLGGLQLAISAEAVRALAASHGLARVRSGADVVAAASLSGERGERAARVLTVLAERTAVAVAALVTVVDPALVVLAGYLTQDGGRWVAPVRAALDRLLPAAPPLVAGELGADAVRRGAELAAVDRVQDALLELVAPSAGPRRSAVA